MTNKTLKPNPPKPEPDPAPAKLAWINTLIKIARTFFGNSKPAPKTITVNMDEGKLTFQEKKK